MYQLVADVERYPEFLPWCSGTRIIAQGDGEVVASVSIAYHGIRKSFTTRNRMQPGERIDIELVDGPFSHLVGTWSFDALAAGASQVSLTMEFGFATRLLDKVVGPVFKHIGNSMVDAFCRRADRVHGTGVEN